MTCKLCGVVLHTPMLIGQPNWDMWAATTTSHLRSSHPQLYRQLEFLSFCAMAALILAQWSPDETDRYQMAVAQSTAEFLNRYRELLADPTPNRINDLLDSLVQSPLSGPGFA